MVGVLIIVAHAIKLIFIGKDKMIINFMFTCNWPKGWDPTMDLHICQEAVGSVLNNFSHKFNNPIVELPEIDVMKTENAILFSF